MFKKLVVASLVIAAGSSFAGDMYAPKKTYDKDKPCNTHEFLPGPYLGLSVGVRNNFTGSNGIAIAGTTNNTPAVYQAIEGTIAGGYALTFNHRWYLAAEVFGADSARTNNLVRPSGYGVESTWSYGGDVIPGVILTDDFLAYLRVGGLGTRFNTLGVTKGAWQIGGGGQVNLLRNLDLRAEYVFSDYTSVSPFLNRIAANQFNVGIIYKFV